MCKLSKQWKCLCVFRFYTHWYLKLRFVLNTFWLKISNSSHREMIKKLSWMDPKLKNKLIPNYFFYRVGTKWWKSLRKFSTWKLHPCCCWWLKNTKHPKRGIYSFWDFWFWWNPHKTKFVLTKELVHVQFKLHLI